MKKNILRIALIGCLLLTSLFWGGAVFAQDEDLPDPGITPDSPFYFLDKLGKNIGMFFTFGAEAKAKKALNYAEERLSEAQAMADKNKIREMTRAANDYEGFMAMVNKRLEAAERNGTSANVSERLSAVAYRIHTRLCELKDRLPAITSDNVTPADDMNTEEAAAAIERAKATTINSQIKALRILARNKTDKALDIGSETIDKLMERARERVRVRVSDNVSDNASRDINADLDYAAKIAELEEEMVQIAEEKGLDITAIQQRLAQSTTNRLEVLTEVYEDAPEAARQGIENAIENSVDKYERVVERLREKNAEITANATALQNIPEKIKEKLKLQVSNAVQMSDEAINNIKAQIRTETENREQNQEQLSNSETGASGNQTGEQKELQTQTKERTGN